MFKSFTSILLLAVSLSATVVIAGNPAARVGDTMSSGGVILPPGEPTVLIGGKPAARETDMTLDPRVLPGPVSCVGGPIINGSATVLIGGLPAARVGDQALSGPCPPHSIILGEPTVLIGG